MKIFPIVLALLISVSALAQKPRKLTANQKASKIVYAMSHPMHDWEGISTTGRCLIVFDDESNSIKSVAVIAPVKGFDTGNSNRDSHTIEMLEGLKYPNVTFSSTSIQEVGNELAVQGTLTFHGVSKPISFKATKKRSGSQLQVAGSFPTKLSDHKIERPTLMGVPTKDEIIISFQLSFDL